MGVEELAAYPHPIFMATLEEIKGHVVKYPQALDIRAAMGHTRSLEEKMNLAAMTPRGDLASTHYCLANPGNEYLIYLPSGGKVTVDLSVTKGALAAEWFNPHSGATTGGGMIEGGTEVTRQAPFESDAILCPRETNRRETMSDRMSRREFVKVLAAGSAVSVAAGDEPPSAELTELARQYLRTTDVAAKQELARRLDAQPADPEQVVRALRPKPAGNFQAGYFPSEHFQTPELRERHADDLLFYVVPESYDPGKPTGLIVLMHGGGPGRRDWPDAYMKLADSGYAFGQEFAKTGMIAVGPSAPWSETSAQRWCLPEADDYIRDVVIEFENRFNIDPDRVVVVGYSMGGGGAYHQVQRQPDRFAAVVAGAGAWQLAYWPIIRGTPLWIVHGVHDTVPGKRPHYTDIEHARHAHRLLTEQDIVHEYREHPGGHEPDDARQDLRFFIEQMPAMRRDPYYPHVVAVSPRGYTSTTRYKALHNRWVSIVETTEGSLTHDCLLSEGPRQFWGMPLENWSNWRLIHERKDLPGAMLEAVNRGNNRIEVTTRNVRRFSLWLHPKMVEFSKQVSVTIDGVLAFNRIVTPLLSTALRSYERRLDWGLIYPAEIELSVTSKPA